MAGNDFLNNEDSKKAKTMKGTTMNPLTLFNKISILPLRIAQALAAFIALTAVPAVLGEGTQHRDAAPPDVTVSGNFGRMFRNLPPFAPPTNAVRDALMELGSLGGSWMRTTIWQRVLWR